LTNKGDILRVGSQEISNNTRDIRFGSNLGNKIAGRLELLATDTFGMEMPQLVEKDQSGKISPFLAKLKCAGLTVKGFLLLIAGKALKTDINFLQ